MTDNWQRFTNKMLYHAQVQLETWKKTEGPAESVFREACIHNMVFTYQSLLAEILAVYQIPVKKLPDLNDALALLYQKHEISSELAYIQQLEKKPGWLLALKKAYSESLSPSASLSMKQSHELSLKNMDDAVLSTPNEVSGALNALRELITYSRNYSFEW